MRYRINHNFSDTLGSASALLQENPIDSFFGKDRMAVSVDDDVKPAVFSQGLRQTNTLVLWRAARVYSEMGQADDNFRPQLL